MSDADAFMALVLENTQSELHPLEEGLHALKSGMQTKEYAAKIGRPPTTLQTKVQASRVFETIKTHVSFGDPRPFWRCLAEIHAAPQWLWAALVEATVGKPQPTVAFRIQAARVAEACSHVRTADLRPF